MMADSYSTEAWRFALWRQARRWYLSRRCCNHRLQMTSQQPVLRFPKGSPPSQAGIGWFAEGNGSRKRLEWSGIEFKRVTINARQMGGVPCLRGLRIPVATIVALVAEGQTTSEILALYPDLEAEDNREALLFAAEAVRERALPLAAGE